MDKARKHSCSDHTSSACSFACFSSLLFFLPMPLYLRRASVPISWCYKNTLPFFSPRTVVYLFLSARFLSKFWVLGCRHASLNRSRLAILSRLSFMLNEGPTSRNGTVFICTFASVISSDSKCLNSIGSFSPRHVNTITRLSSWILASCKLLLWKKSKWKRGIVKRLLKMDAKRAFSRYTYLLAGS